MPSRMTVAVALVTATTLLAGCGDQTSVASDGSVASPYQGPLVLPQDFGDRATAEERSGAAGRAVECVYPVGNGGSGDYDSGLASVQDDPEAALENWLEEEGAWFSGLPDQDYRVERDDGDRVMFSYDLVDKSKAVVIVSDGVHDWNDHTGWGVESWAQCDPAELPAELTEARGIGVWTDRSGVRVPTTVIQSYDGAEHCDWHDIVFLQLGTWEDGEQYLRDTEGVLSRSLRSTYDDAVPLPARAEDTGWRRDGRELWLTPDAAYLVSVDDPDDVERWPRGRERIACA